MVTGRVAVVGAGLAGLSAGLDLKSRGFSVDLFERTRLLGGKATSYTVAGTEIDNGQHVYLACCTEFIDFIQALQPDFSGSSLLSLQPRFDVLLLRRNHRPARLREVPLPAPFHLLPALACYGHLRPRARLAVARALLAARRTDKSEGTFARWLDRQRQPAEARSHFWDPFLVPALNAPLDKISADAGLFVISTAFLGGTGSARFGYARVPLAQIAAAAAQHLDNVHLQTSVAGLAVETGTSASGARVVLTLNNGGRCEYAGVILAVPPARLRRLLGRPETFGVTGLDDFRTSPIIDVHLWYDVPRPHFDFAAILDSPVQWVFVKGPGYLCCSLSAAKNQMDLSKSELVELCHRELAAVLPTLRDRPPVRGAATRDREATFVPVPGLRRPDAATASPRVTIAGAWTNTGWPATMESAVRSGRTAARVLSEGLQG